MRVHARLSVRCNLLLGFLDILRLSVSLSLSVFLLRLNLGSHMCYIGIPLLNCIFLEFTVLSRFVKNF